MPRKTLKNSSVNSSTESSVTIKDNRFHFVKGIGWLPRVSFINSYFPKGEGFSRFLAGAASYEAAEQIKNDAAERGTRVHQACEKLVKKETVSFHDYSLEEWHMIKSFVAFVEDFNPAFLATELFVYSEEHGYAGSLDYLVQIGEEQILLDIKTSSAIYSSFFTQTSAYAFAGCERKLMKPELKTAILRLGSKHKRGYEYAVEKKPWTESFKTFLAVKQIFHNENPNLKPSITIEPATLTLENLTS